MTPLTLLYECVCVCVCVWECEFRLLYLQQSCNQKRRKDKPWRWQCQSRSCNVNLLWRTAGSCSLFYWHTHTHTQTHTDMCYCNWPRVTLLSTFSFTIYKHTWELQTVLKYPDLIVMPEYKMYDELCVCVCVCVCVHRLPKHPLIAISKAHSYSSSALYTYKE